MLTSNIRTEKRKHDLRDFDHDMFVGARQFGLSFSETAELLGYSHTTFSLVFTS